MCSLMWCHRRVLHCGIFLPNPSAQSNHEKTSKKPNQGTFYKISDQNFQNGQGPGKQGKTEKLSQIREDEGDITIRGSVISSIGYWNKNGALVEKLAK